MVLLIALAIRLWLTGRRPVSFECLILPIGVIYSDIIEKFYASNQTISLNSSDFRNTTYQSRFRRGGGANPIILKRLKIQDIENVIQRP